MTDDENTSSTWWDFLMDNLRSRGLSTGDLARGAGVDRSRLSDWKRGGKASVESARAIAVLFDASPLEVMVAAGLITPNEAALRQARPDPARLTDDELVAELRKRLGG
ncbi:transcriptional regulator with XRE-family HTH domain [Saccharothrix tamanrassetensis]|uniref:Transcriptional regulator with XRE-family HTH domain n=1 Tax=Saccharothrix tamanrassetensis TaxID=1051531 RepID=A0A841CJY5_9PSEU|nr:helix-turn-helix transcriptional regulator [Saccharothrix tamanrassetensis]MBB5956417.1 transcriptional regulator with XRE-family HTH domain [Saccharothrix tamanrassetensis]